ncbi:MAG: hypothetical protein ACKOUR_03515, partial [Planctomycetota bacterium]
REQSFVAMSFPRPEAVTVLVNGCHPRTPLKGWAYARTATKCRPALESSGTASAVRQRKVAARRQPSGRHCESFHISQ